MSMDRGPSGDNQGRNVRITGDTDSSEAFAAPWAVADVWFGCAVANVQVLVAGLADRRESLHARRSVRRRTYWLLASAN
ncbi:hypothetical protein A5666_16835 [Mycolicibacterium fortuitum]|nr:hypothetical protein A5665_07300 [Mycolicibacterium fortuitum]OBI59951.1 hypothetical protein A5666_16835 [Mycolicibacterium fortuitum]